MSEGSSQPIAPRQAATMARPLARTSGRPPVILVAGMHRSGTSLVGLLLDRLGIPVPGELIGPDRHNQSGYFERADITALQERLLIDLGRWWPSEAGAAPLPADLAGRAPWAGARERLRELLQPESDRQERAWAIKDPRTSLLLPLWRDVAQELDLDLRLVFCVRDPAEVMVSLVHRDGGPAGMTPWRAQRLWWLHNRAILQDGQDLPTLVVHYDDWFRPHRARDRLSGLAAFCDRQSVDPATAGDVLAAVRPDQRRSRLPEADLPLPVHPRLRELDRRLQRLAQGRPADRHRLARTRAWVERHSAALEQAEPPAFGSPQAPHPRLARLLDGAGRWLAERRVGG